MPTGSAVTPLLCSVCDIIEELTNLVAIISKTRSYSFWETLTFAVDRMAGVGGSVELDDAALTTPLPRAQQGRGAAAIDEALETIDSVRTATAAAASDKSAG